MQITLVTQSNKEQEAVLMVDAVNNNFIFCLLNEKPTLSEVMDNDEKRYFTLKPGDETTVSITNGIDGLRSICVKDVHKLSHDTYPYKYALKELVNLTEMQLIVPKSRHTSVKPNPPEYIQGLTRIQQCCVSNGFDLLLMECESLWGVYSCTKGITWVIVPEELDEIWEAIKFSFPSVGIEK